MKLKMVKTCPMCGTEFVSRSKLHTYCSNRCWDMHDSVKELYHHLERLGEPRHLNCILATSIRGSVAMNAS